MDAEIRLQPELMKAVRELGFSKWTDIQRKAIPLVQAGRDVIGQSMTGSGKTAAFGLPLLEATIHGAGLQALVLVPTRELCEQVSVEMRKFSRHRRASIIAVYGGVGIARQIEELRRADIVIGTPGRILDHMERGTIVFQKLRVLVLDEADKMFEMGFIDDIRRIISRLPRERQTLLFSATMPPEIMELVRQHMRSPEKVKVQSYVDQARLVQQFYSVGMRDKFSLLVHVIKSESPELTMIFCGTRRMVDSLTMNLGKQGIKALAIHGGLAQNRRKQVMDMFHNGKRGILVASDVAARGLDIKDVSHVINYDLPKSSNDYIHRIGRTAREGKEGRIISILSEPDHDNFRRILEDRSIVIEQLPLPSFERLPFTRPERRGGFGGREGRSGYGGISLGRGGRLPSYSSRPRDPYSQRMDGPRSERRSGGYASNRGEGRGGYSGRNDHRHQRRRFERR